jgi:hypothetical protein
VRLIRKVGMENIEDLVSQARLSCIYHQYKCRSLEAIKVLLRVYIHYHRTYMYDRYDDTCM